MHARGCLDNRQILKDIEHWEYSISPWTALPASRSSPRSSRSVALPRPPGISVCRRRWSANTSCHSRSGSVRACSIAPHAKSARPRAGALQSTPKGLLRLNGPLSFGVRQLAPAILDYLAACTEAEIDLTLTDRIVDLVEEGFDLAIRIARLADSTLIARRIAPCRIVACAAPAYLKRHGAPRRPADLAAHNCLGYSYAALRNEWRFTGPDGVESVRVAG